MSIVYDFFIAATVNAKRLRMLNVIDEIYPRKPGDPGGPH
jgi:hypothetical protein